MRRYIYIPLIIIGCFILSCADHKDYSSLPEDIKNNSVSLDIDTVDIPDNLIYAREFRVYHDSILIVLNKKYDDVSFVEMYRLKDHKLIRSFFRLGNGPNELLSALVKLNGDVLTVNDYVKNQIAFLNLDSVLANPLYNVTPIRYYTESPVAAQHLVDSQLIIENPNYFVDDNLGINTNTTRLLVADKNSIPKGSENNEYYVRNVTSDGHIIVNYKLNKIIYAYMGKPIIEFYDRELKLTNRILGPDKLPAKYKIIDKEVIYDEYIPYAYLDFCTDENYFYLTYMGANLVAGKNMEDYPLWIFKFAWNGDFIKSYNIRRYISSISISNNGKSFYGTGVDKDKNPILLKLSIR